MRKVPLTSVALLLVSLLQQVVTTTTIEYYKFTGLQLFRSAFDPVHKLQQLSAFLHWRINVTIINELLRIGHSRSTHS